MNIKEKIYRPIFLILIYLIITIAALASFQEHGVHIEEKYHRLNGLFWLNHIAQIFNFENLSFITEKKMIGIGDYTLNRPADFPKYGIILDLPLAFIEIVFELEKIENIYYLKQSISFLIFLISSLFFYKLLIKRFNNFFLCLAGIILFITSPRIFGDSFLYKDVLFLSFFVISLYYFFNLTENLNKRDLFLFAVFNAISFNLRFFAAFLPIVFLIFLILKNFKDKKIVKYFKIYSIYFFLVLFFIVLFSPYLWTNTFSNLIEIFRPLKNASIGEDIKILFNGNFYSNRYVPETYLFTWIFITTPIITLILFLFGYIFYVRKFINRFINLKKSAIYNDLWRSQNESKDFISFLILTSFVFTLLIFNSPFYNGWRLVYFLNIFIIYFAVYQINNLSILFRKVLITKKLLVIITILAIIHNVISLIKYHPFQSYYFSEIITNKMKNSFEGDYYGLSGKHFFQRLNLDYQNSKFKIAVASHTPLQRSLESVSRDVRKNFEVIGQDYQNADFIYKNNISEVNSRLNKKYNIPANFVKVYELNIDGTVIYEIFKNNR